jgi:hypothetical protein
VTDYKKYALGQVENFLYDAMSTDATPQEIYDTIRGVVEDNYYTYKNSASEAYELLALLNGNGVGHVNLAQEHSKYYDDYYRNKPVVKTCDKDNISEECKESWSDFWEDQQYTDEELNAMCDAVTSAKMGKVNRWIIPVDDDYNITFPEDLLEQTGWKAGDTLEWHDQNDGSFKLIKKEN